MNSLIKSAIKRQMRWISSAFTRSGPTFWKIHNNKVLNNGKQRLYWTLNRVFLSYVALLVIGFMFLVLLSALCFPGTINNLKTDSVENSLRQKSKKKFSSIISSKEFRPCRFFRKRFLNDEHLCHSLFIAQPPWLCGSDEKCRTRLLSTSWCPKWMKRRSSRITNRNPSSVSVQNSPTFLPNILPPKIAVLP